MAPPTESLRALKEALPAERVYPGYPLASLTSFKCQGVALAMVKVHSVPEILSVLEVIKAYSLPVLILGKGSNTIFSEDSFSGVIINLAGGFKALELLSAGRIKAGASATTVKLAAFAREHGLKGLEFMATVPGTVGGAVFMNAGAHGSETKDSLESAEFLTPDGKQSSAANDELRMSYRFSRFQENAEIITSAVFRLDSGDPAKIRAKEQELQKLRQSRQPINKPTWGSVFKNPPGASAGQLIESCGLKGTGHGKAMISPLHANFIENVEGAATAQDAIATIRIARDAVLKQHGITLHPEVRIYNATAQLIEI